MENAVIPPELKSFHQRSMAHVFGVGAFPMAAGAGAAYMQANGVTEPEWLETGLIWLFCGGVVAVMILMLYKALFARPHCPDCKCKMVERETIEIDMKAFWGSEASNWRIVECEQCGKRYRIPGLS